MHDVDHLSVDQYLILDGTFLLHFSFPFSYFVLLVEAKSKDIFLAQSFFFLLPLIHFDHLVVYFLFFIKLAFNVLQSALLLLHRLLGEVQLGLGLRILIDTLLQQGALLEEGVQRPGTLNLQQLLGLLLLQDGDGVLCVDAETLEDPLPLLPGLLVLLDDVLPLILDEDRRHAGLPDGAVEGDAVTIDIQLVRVLALILQCDLIKIKIKCWNYNIITFFLPGSLLC